MSRRQSVGGGAPSVRSRRAAYSPRLLAALAVLGLLNALLIGAAARMAYFPSDLAIARAVQSFVPLPVSWASWITATADVPGCFVLLGLAIVAAWLISGWRAAAIAVPVFFGLWLFGVWLSPRVAQPRPWPGLIQVVGHPKGYAFPSIFGLVYVATAGYPGLLAARRCRGLLRVVIPALAILALIVGGCARIVLGAHWPSDLWAAYLMGLFWIAALIPLARPERGPQ